MSQTVVNASSIFDGEVIHQLAQLVIENEVVVELITDLKKFKHDVDFHIDGLIVPGFIDLQVNGGGGVLLNNQPDIAGVRTMLSAHQAFGTTGMLPTLITDTASIMTKAADAIAGAISSGASGILGVHFEGPHLSVAKKGAHSSEYIRSIGDAEWQVLSRKDLGQIAVTVAPETVSPEDITRMVELGIKVFLGHSDADFATAKSAIDAGASGFTHLFNAMSPMTGREPGMVGAALYFDQTVCGLIVDGHHVDYHNCQTAIKTKPPGGVVLVTDAMSVVGTNIERFDFFDREIIRDGDKLNSTTGELAGSALDMASAVRNSYRHLALPLEEVLRMASYYPARYLGMEKSLGHLRVGAQANFAVLSPELMVTQTWVSGTRLTN